jgi:hypothetical protein
MRRESGEACAIPVGLREKLIILKKKEIEMRRVLRFCLILTLISAGLGFASDIDGKWNGKIAGPEGDMDLTFTFKVSGDTLTGAVETMMGEMPISNGKVNGSEFFFDVSFGDMAIRHWCKASADSILMKYTGMQADTLRLVLKRPVTTP